MRKGLSREERESAREKEIEMMRLLLCAASDAANLKLLLLQGYSHPADLWAAGCVLYFLVEGTNPFEPCDTFQNLCHKVSSRPVGFKSQVSPEELPDPLKPEGGSR